jgi:hypothetical protein
LIKLRDSPAAAPQFARENLDVVSSQLFPAPKRFSLRPRNSNSEDLPRCRRAQNRIGKTKEECASPPMAFAAACEFRKANTGN